MNIKYVILRFIKMDLLAPFVTSYGKVQKREMILVEVEDTDGVTGWGEVVAFSIPWYTEETIQTCFHVLDEFLIPSLLKGECKHPEDLTAVFSPVKRNRMAKAGLDTALWDLYATKREKPLASVLGGTRNKIEAGVVIGIDDIPKMLAKIEQYLKEGYKRFKVKIKPGYDYELIRQIRKEYPSLPLMADANSAYTLHDIERLKLLDEFELMMIEQPLDSDDIVDHAKLQREIMTPICLDESIVSYDDVRKAIELGSCQIVNVKVGRVGGLTEAKRIHDLCLDQRIDLWVGGMLESGVSRAHNIALASLPGFTIPGDISASSRYWEKDVIVPEVIVTDGYIQVPSKIGMGFEIDREFLKKVTYETKTYKAM
ncbi:o-succinylbenzoate synthase [Bacillus songklensis]|uniref:o-succinylbenzoate synthase n=1 Tax=Bacillus songklensis TaxID=1069116 RepID=A0ABV8B5T6_9BACI